MILNHFQTMFFFSLSLSLAFAYLSKATTVLPEQGGKPRHKDLAHWEFAQDRILLAVPKDHPLTKRGKIRLRDLRDMPFIWFQRLANPTFDNQNVRLPFKLIWKKGNSLPLLQKFVTQVQARTITPRN